MAEGEPSPTGVSGYLANWKDYWKARFVFLDNYKQVFLIPEKPLPKWSAADVEEFIASDPVHGPALKTARDVAKFAGYGSAVGAISTAGFAWKYSKSPHGAVLALGAGAIFGWTFAQEIASHWTQIYCLDTMEAQRKYLDWWKKKCEA